MSLHDRMKQIFSTPSHRRDADYSKEIPPKAKYGALLYYQDLIVVSHIRVSGLLVSDPGGEWMREVLRHMCHAHLEMNQLTGVVDGARDALEILSRHLLDKSTPSSHFLDFLELSLRLCSSNSDAFATGNDFVDGLNVVLDERGSPYLLTRYAYTQEEHDDSSFQPFSIHTSVSAYPKAYLKQSGIPQQHAVEPALRLLADPVYEVSNNDFLKALERRRHNDYDGVLTSCATTLEGAIKAAAQVKGWRIRGNGLGTIFQSYASKSRTVPDQLKTVVNFLQERRSKAGDAHGHTAKDKISEEEADFVISLTAALVCFLAAAT